MKHTPKTNYAIIEAKKADLNSLSNEIKVAKYKVSEMQAIVTALEQKSSEFSMFLESAETSKETTLSNLNLFKSTLNSVTEFLGNAVTQEIQATDAHGKIDSTATEVSGLINRLIYSGEMINKFAQLVFHKKQYNPLISDELVKTVTTANADVNEAIAATLTALTSCYSTKAVAGESVSLCTLDKKQATKLLDLMRVKTTPATASSTPAPDQQASHQQAPHKQQSLHELLHNAYDNAKLDYKQALRSSEIVTKQTEHAQTSLNNATSQLSSLQAGLSAATAAALAA